ncbi:sugar kinase [Wenxinia saemankumensis]|uniref:2-keto-3-deoxygluconate kinase n=1 Tax=Wenxinia saemankumensis TaxID=1447782 RepID=A0A1M6CCI9_9RHOB|nr:sugar kinase [Wenxinia saemankumensis]SHI58583.1 2-keto-3-deoxygluconate kinase [Wenxinia saemankumensis]
MPRIACIGEAMIELVPEGAERARLGVAGDTLNVAVYLARLLRGTGWSVDYMTALGTDAFSDRIAGAVAAHGIGTGAIERRPDKGPGLYAISTDAAGERSFTYWRSDSAARTLFAAPGQVGLDRLAGYDLVLLSGISLAILPAERRAALTRALAGARQGGTRIAYDSNHRPRLWESAAAARDANDAVWAVTDIALPSLDDERAIHADADEAAVLARLRARGLTEGALKRGAAGPVALDPDVVAGPFAPAPSVVDTTAAGDSFDAGFLAARLTGSRTEEAMAAGHALASRVVGISGAILPD